jgi:hypothetical protein
LGAREEAFQRFGKDEFKRLFCTMDTLTQKIAGIPVKGFDRKGMLLAAMKREDLEGSLEWVT